MWTKGKYGVFLDINPRGTVLAATLHSPTASMPKGKNHAADRRDSTGKTGIKKPASAGSFFGVGLAIERKIVQYYTNSPKNKGATFR
ncbi:hypothetical protein [Citrobacter telavivensis]|uniref:hypothetical protein n=1 Tax=Citrobacter telavivensis TaxID=2653932 RepID=UPI00359DFB4C